MRINKYDDITDSLLERIARGEFASRLPGFRQLAAEYQVSKRTLGKAMLRLKEAGYILPGPRGTRPNPERRPRARTHRIVLLAETSGGTSGKTLVRFLKELAEAAGNTFCCESPDSVTTPLADGYIFYGSVFDPELTERFRREGVAFVSVNMLPDDCPISWVDLTSRNAIFACLNRMIARNKKRIAFYHPLGSSTASLGNWQMVYRDFAAERREFLLKDSGLDIFIPRHSNDGAEFVDFLLKQEKFPQVIMQINWHDELHQALLARGLVPGRDVMMLCLEVGEKDNRNWAETTWQLLVRRMRDPYAPPRHIRVPLENSFEEITFDNPELQEEKWTG